MYENVICDDNLELDENATATVEEFNLEKPTVVTGNVSCNGRGVLLLGIPYQEGWKVYIDGKKVDKIYRVDYGFIGVVLEKGDHEIQLKYSIPKVELGAIFTAVGLLNFCILFYNSRKSVKRRLYLYN